MVVDLGSIGTLITALNGAKNLAQTMIGLRDTAAFQEKVIEFQGKILDAQDAAFAAQQERTALLGQVGDLEKELAQLKGWEAEKERYDLIALAPNVVARAIKESMRGAEARHLLCANCFNTGKKSHLQQVVRGDYHDSYKCNTCGEVLGVDKGTPPVQSARPDRYDPYG
ncbi:MAG TPA: hypothetical protein VGR52_03845 [Stellaceae bacterium]|nr:hypothetical protein [Stellaceae bacterium]